MTYQLITTSSALAAFCAKAASAEVLAVDTEFVRQTTLSPKLGLIQLFDGQRLVLVDPLAIEDWSPLQQLFANPAVCKVIHSCNEDLEALATKNLLPVLPLIDTQLAAELAGWGGSLGYAKLVQRVCAIELDKSESRTDWIARPLSPLQLDYAAKDVEHLLDVYQALKTELLAKGHYDLLLAEGGHLISRRSFALPLAFRHLELKNSNLLAPRELAILRDLVSWRYSYAQQHDMALGFIFKDHHLLDIAKRRPGSLESMFNIPELPGREVRRHGKTVLAIIEQAKALPLELCPQPYYHKDTFPGFKEGMAQISEAIKAAAKESGIAAEFIAVRRQSTEFFNWCWRVSDEDRVLLPVPEFLRGWRRELLLCHLPIPQHLQSVV
jgi:ribonuclease D